MCFHIGSSGHRRDRSLSPPPRPVRRSRHFPEFSDPSPSVSTRHRRKQPDPKAIRQHARRSTPLVFEGESSSAQTPRHRSRKQSDEPRAKTRRRRHRPSRRIQKWAASIPEDVEDSDPPEATLTRRQGKQPESRLEDPVVDGETKELEGQSGKLFMKSSAENKKTAENDEAESSKTTVGTKEKQESKPCMYAKTRTEPTEKILPESSRTAGQTNAQKSSRSKETAARSSEQGQRSEMTDESPGQNLARPISSTTSTSTATAPEKLNKYLPTQRNMNGNLSFVASGSNGGK